MSWQQLLNANATAQKQSSGKTRPWPANSPFAWLLPLAPVSKGAAGLRIVRELMHLNGYTTGKASGIAQAFSSNHGIIKTKISLEWNSGNFVFEQIRDDPYDFLAMLGLCPEDAFIWLCPKHVALAESASQQAPQSRWIHVDPVTPPIGFAGCGGPIADAAVTFKTVLGAPP
jgi:hypothetical protein